jgi:hypothetical protein
MTANYVLLEKITVGAAGASSVTFSGIPQTGYTDLVIKMSTRNADNVNSFAHVNIRFNGDTGSNYQNRSIRGDGGSAISTNSTNTFIIASYSNGNAATANSFGSGEVYVPNYTSSNQKSVSIEGVNETNASTAYMNITAGLWTGTSAITSINLSDQITGNNFVQYSTFYLYGVAKLGTTPAIVPYATGGDTIETDGTYWYHAFLSSGTFTPQKGISCDVLVVAGGGGGGNTFGGGGAAGGLFYSASTSVATAQTVTIGAGGAGATGRASKGASGSNSVFGSLTAAVGGGGGGSYDTKNGATGGSGGGGGGESGTGGSATSGQGNAGGAASGGHGAGGGGASGVGGSASGSTIGNGGAASNTYSSWLSVIGLGVSGFIAGGGSGGSNNDGTTLGTVSGGAGQGQYANGNAATANTGSGGGGGGLTGGVDGNGGAGGSGLVVIRYAV